MWTLILYTQHTVPPTGGWGGNRSSLPWAPSVRGAPNSAELFQISHHSHPSLASLRGSFCCIIVFKSACFFASHFRCWRKFKLMHTLSYGSLCSRWLGPHTSYFSIWNHQTKMRKRSLRSPQRPRAHFGSCKISKFLGGRPPDAPHTIYSPTFYICPGPLQSSWQPCQHTLHTALENYTRCCSLILSWVYCIRRVTYCVYLITMVTYVYRSLYIYMYC